MGNIHFARFEWDQCGLVGFQGFPSRVLWTSGAGTFHVAGSQSASSACPQIFEDAALKDLAD
jgi:hypothetical protein